MIGVVIKREKPAGGIAYFVYDTKGNLIGSDRIFGNTFEILNNL